MAEIIRNRTIRPSTRLEKSKSYKIDTRSVTATDTLIVNIDHERKSFKRTYKFRGADVAKKDSISFRLKDYGTKIDISWSGAEPIGVTRERHVGPPETKSPLPKEAPNKKRSTASRIHQKTSFEPISDADTRVLILGTLPGDRSLALGEYYANPGNRFWKIITEITGSELPTTYAGKKKLLLQSKIGIWDIAHHAIRQGSLDSAMKNEVPNDLLSFISKHKKLKMIAFNGAKSEKLYDRFFPRSHDISYYTLPSSSGANTGISLAVSCEHWQQILKNGLS